MVNILCQKAVVAVPSQLSYLKFLDNAYLV